MRARTSRSLAAAVAVAIVAVLAPAQAAAATEPYPSSMSALGNSITRGFNASGWFVDWPSRSWATGTHAGVNSHYSRIRAVNPDAVAYNDAKTGARVADLDRQAGIAAGRGVDYVTILIGANDACASSEAEMTPVTTFRAEFAEAMAVLASRAPQARVLVVSIPDLKRLWSVGWTNLYALAAWSAYKICPTMLANPLSFARADIDRRNRVRQRVIDYNTQLAEVCATYVSCRYDGGAVFRYPFALSQLSTWDYFHPNVSGQAALAEVSNDAGYQW